MRTFDLDAAAVPLSAKRLEWIERGLIVGLVTWAEGQTTVNPLVTDRAQLGNPYSLGVQVTSGSQEGELVLYAGGWADLIYWNGTDDQPFQRVPGYDDGGLDQQGWVDLLDEFGSMFD